MHASWHRTIIALGLLGLFRHSTAVAAQTLAALQSDIAAANGRVVVGIKPGNAPRGMAGAGVRFLTKTQVGFIAQRLSGFGLRVTRNYGLITAVAGVVVSDAAVAALVNDPNVEYVVPDRIHRLHDERGRSAAVLPLQEVMPYGIAKIRAPDAWGSTVPANYGAGVKVGILDTGGDIDHQDLAFAGGFDAVAGSTAPGDWDDNLSSCGGHGTHVAGTVGAMRNNGVGVVGVAPGASVYAIQVFVEIRDPKSGATFCGAFMSDVIAGVEWAVTNGIQVLNMSFGGDGLDPAEHAAYQAAYAAGVNLIASAGNAAGPTSGNTPAAYPEVIAVAATDALDGRAVFSNFGSEILVSAPGVDVLSTLPGNDYAYKSGTSMAAPHVTGLVALLLAVDPTLSNTSIRGLLGAGAVDLGAAGRDDLFGEGRIDALNSVGLSTPETTAATQLALVQQPGAGTSGQPLVPAPTVELRDGLNQAVLQAGVVVTATISSGPGRASTAVVTNASGQAVFSSLAVHTFVTAQHELTFSAGALTPVVSAPFMVTGSLTTLSNGVPVSGLGGPHTSLTYFVLTVPAGVGTLEVITTGGTGDAQIVGRFGVPPTLVSYDCAGFAPDNEEHCLISNPSAGDWYFVLYGFSDYAGLTLTATASGAGATQMSLLQQPSAATSGQPLTPAPVVQLLDAQGQPVALFGVAVTAAISNGPGEITGLAGPPAPKIGEVAGRHDPIRPLFITAGTDATGQATFSSLTVWSLPTADHQLVFSASNVTPLVSEPFNVTGITPTPLTHGVPVQGLAGAAGSLLYYVLAVPVAQTNLTVTLSGGTGDADLYVKEGAPPTTLSYDCRPFLIENPETCSLANPAAGTWHILVRGYEAYTGVTLTASHTGATSLGITLGGTGAGTITGPSGLSCALAAGQTIGTCSVQVTNPSSVVLHAQPATGSGFVWGGAAGTSCAFLRDCTVQISGTTAVSAVFNLLPDYLVAVGGTGTGSGTVTGVGIRCMVNAGAATGSCSVAHDSGTAITLTASPDAGRVFYGWSGDCTGTGICQLQMTQARSATAGFSYPPADVDRMVAELFGTSTLTLAEVQRLNCNASTAFDIGDLLCYLDNNPGLTLGPGMMAAILRQSAATRPPNKPAGAPRED